MCYTLRIEIKCETRNPRIYIRNKMEGMNMWVKEKGEKEEKA